MLLVLTLGLGVIVAGFGMICYLAGRDDGCGDMYTLRLLLRSMEKRFMAQLDDLKLALSEVSAGVASVAAEVDGLLAKLNAPAPDLSEVILQANAIRDAVKAVGDAIPDAPVADPAPAPAPEPPAPA